MESHILKIQSTEKVTHDVVRIILEEPPEMIDAVQAQLNDLGVGSNSIVVEI